MEVDFKANIQRAIELLEAMKDEDVDLGFWRVVADCGTICCAAGWCARDPFFNAQGLVEDDGSPKAIPAIAKEFDLVTPAETLAHFFGEGAYPLYFSPIWYSPLDSNLLPIILHRKHKEISRPLAIARLKYGLSLFEKEAGNGS